MYIQEAIKKCINENKSKNIENNFQNVYRLVIGPNTNLKMFNNSELMDDSWEFVKEKKKVEAINKVMYKDSAYVGCYFDKTIPRCAKIYAEWEE
jgi:hypothetical protein